MSYKKSRTFGKGREGDEKAREAGEEQMRSGSPPARIVGTRGR